MIDCIGNGDSIESKLGISINPLYAKPLPKVSKPGVVSTEGGIIIPGDEGSSRGIHPRWGKVYSVGPEQKDIKKGEWVLVDHGRWTRGVTLVTDDGEELQVRRVDIKDILGTQDTKPNAVYQSGVYSGNAEQVDTLGRLDKD